MIIRQPADKTGTCFGSERNKVAGHCLERKQFVRPFLSPTLLPAVMKILKPVTAFADKLFAVMPNQSLWNAFLQVKHTSFSDEVRCRNLSQMYPQMYHPSRDSAGFTGRNGAVELPRVTSTLRVYQFRHSRTKRSHLIPRNLQMIKSAFHLNACYTMAIQPRLWRCNGLAKLAYF